MRVNQQSLVIFIFLNRHSLLYQPFFSFDLDFCLFHSISIAPKSSVCNTGDLGSIPGLGRSPGEGNGSPLQYSCLENPMDGGAWWATVHGVAKSRTQLSDFTHSLTLSGQGCKASPPETSQHLPTAFCRLLKVKDTLQQHTISWGEKLLLKNDLEIRKKKYPKNSSSNLWINKNQILQSWKLCFFAYWNPHSHLATRYSTLWIKATNGLAVICGNKFESMGILAQDDPRINSRLVQL